ncbi:coiled-coil domain-containing protein 77 [Eurytemora carolleeae]|uniref:coiled-coil domain-containing protein 77 n=1 Tax=Eurytemora carolleeae TaxID=1294199 RepID=UPI000C777C46|nr:coiled-coil domain-containing protein 77 [Eurytemora carolleeae]|eukprot:XP_023342758.1 coiled-coil domain-containing protein 77-like [Eurytemora affinis]
MCRGVKGERRSEGDMLELHGGNRYSCLENSHQHLSRAQHSVSFAILQEASCLTGTRKDIRPKYERQDKYLLDRIQSVSNIQDTSRRLEAELMGKNARIDELEKQVLLFKNKFVLLEANAKRGAADRVTKSGRSTERDGSLSRGGGLRAQRDQKSEVEYLKNQILQQEQLHKIEMAQERDVFKKNEDCYRSNLLQLNLRISEQNTCLAELNRQFQDLGRTVLKERNENRANERAWLEEKTKLTRKLEYFGKFGSPLVPGLINGGNLEQRSQHRKSGEKVLVREMTRLQTVVQDREETIQQLRSELSLSGGELEELKVRFQKTVKQEREEKSRKEKEINLLKDRLNKLEIRRKREASGYQADIQKLRLDITGLESNILSIISSKHQEKENQRILEDIRQEVSKPVSKVREWRS